MVTVLYKGFNFCMCNTVVISRLILLIALLSRSPSGVSLLLESRRIFPRRQKQAGQHRPEPRQQEQRRQRVLRQCRAYQEDHRVGI